MDNSGSGVVQVFVGEWSPEYEALSIKATKQTSSAEIVECIIERLGLIEASVSNGYELAEVVGNSVGQECKERRLGPAECPVALMLLWPKNDTQQEYYRFYLRKKQPDYLWSDSRFPMDPQLLKDYFNRFLYQPRDKEYPDLCQLPDLNEQTLLDNLRARFLAGNIYTYVGSILIALNPFKFYPIYNPKYVKLYQNRRLGPDIPPHIFAIADAAYHCMLKEKKNQCIVISGESGSGKTESTNFLLHHLTALSQKGSHGSGVEQTILSAGPVLEAFGNAKTAHNNNSSRFGKFIQVNYKENGMVHGAVVQKYLLEKSRIVSQGRNERNYHVFYYLLAGANEQEKQLLHLESCDRYNYLNKSGCYGLENIDERHEFSRLKQSMEMVGFTAEKQRRLFAVLSAVLLLGNVEFYPRKSYHHHDEAVGVKNPEVVALISELLRVKQETLLAALTAKRARASGETLVINYRLPEAIAARDAMAKCLYGALFDWIVLQVNHALLSKKDTLRDHQGNSIGVLDIFGFEDFKTCNSFEQLCINYANEQLQHYFNQHVFQYEQREYRKQGIRWTDIGYSDNSGCLNLIEGKPNGLLCLLDDQCNFPGATNETLLQKFNTVNKENPFYEAPQRREAAFVVRHYAGAVKYQAANMREKNLDLMRPDGVVGVLKNSSLAFVRELVGADPVAVFRWAILRAFFRAHFAFQEAGRVHRHGRVDGNKTSVQNRYRTPNENLISSHKHTRPPSYQKQRSVCLPPATAPSATLSSIQTENNDNINNNRLSWPQFRNINQTQHPSNVTSMKGGYILRGREDQSYSNNKFRRDTHTPLERVLPKDEANVMERANQIVMKNKSFRPRERGKKGLKNLQTVKTLAGRTQSYGTGPGKARKQPMTVSAQFQQSLHSLMDTLNQANPFFIRCIKSNANKIPNEFDEETVQRQLRYTGMLETVRIRQAGFNVRLTYEEFIQLYRMLLPKGLLSSQSDVRDFLLTLNLNRDNYQLGTTKVFLRESEKIKLDIELHQQIITSITTIQKWFRACLERRKFLRLKNAVVQIQSFWRMVSAQRLAQVLRARTEAALHIQTAWRVYKQHSWFKKLKSCVITFQAYVRGNNARKKFIELKKRKRPLPDRIQEVKKIPEYKELIYDKMYAKDSEESFAEDRSLTEYGESPRKVESQNRLTSVRSDNVYRDRDSTLDTSISYSKRKLTPNKRILHDGALKNTETYNFDEITDRKSSLESLTSLRSYESQASINSSESQENSGSRPVPSTRTKRGDHSAAIASNVNILNASSRLSSVSRRTDSSSTGYSDGETESEPPSAVQSAPPVFNTTGHRFRKVARFAKDDVCVCCHEKMDAFVTQGYKCVDCKQLYHVKCIQNGGVLRMPCLLANTPNRRKNRKPPRTPYDTTKQTVASKFNLTGTSAFSDSTDKIISDAKELALMQDFITKKIYKMESQEEGRKPSEVDRVFKHALRKFKDDLVITYSVAIQQGVEGNIKYTDLIANFLHVMETVCKQENTREDFPVTMGVNAFRGFMNEFMAMVKTEAPEKQSKSKRKKEKKRKQEEPIRHGSHMFQLTIINIPTACEVCTSFFMWPIERGLVCQNCKLTCHKKCYMKASAECGKDGSLPEMNSRKVFGVPLYKLDCGDGKVPLVVDRLITTIEMHGLYTEGIYRKSGVSSKVRELKMKMDEGDLEKVDFENYQVHVLAAVLKSFFRDMPEPLLTYEYYDDFLHAANLTDPHDRISTLFAILKKLPKPNYDLMERLIVHLARVARHEVDNRMSSSALAIVFAPCILRTNRTLPAQDSLQDVGRQTRCVETIVQEKLRVVRATLADINTLESACHTATHRLSSLRSSKIFSPEELNVTASSVAGRAVAMDRDRDRGDEEEALLVDHIQEIQKEKDLLTSTLPSLTRASSDDDLLLSATDLDDGSLDDLLPSSADGLVRKKPVQRQSSADNSFPTIINMDDDMVMSVQVSFDHNRANSTVFRETELKQRGQSKYEKHQRLIFSANILQLHIYMIIIVHLNVPSQTNSQQEFLNPAFEIFEESKHNSRHDSFRFPRGNRCRIRAGAVTIKRNGKKYQSCMGLPTWNPAPTMNHPQREEYGPVIGDSYAAVVVVAVVVVVVVIIMRRSSYVNYYVLCLVCWILLGITANYIFVVTVPKIEILGDRDMYVKTGSTVAIRCVIKQSLEGPFYVFWYHEGDRVLNYQLGKIDIQTKRIEQDTVSSLVIHNARREDSGNYTCSPSNLDSASVQLHVLNGEHPAAIQRGISSAPGGCPTLWWLAGVVTLYSSHGSRLFVLVLLILMVLYSKNPSYIATER
ncbi:Myosin-IXa [Atta colombica]|uniref:Myosin-IXa n=1 Tax=Atta colombica TaxID=520822 RepID=A0A195BUT3_9HYME|nr:Myosin-IXa [Atta colombica]